MTCLLALSLLNPPSQLAAFALTSNEAPMVVDVKLEKEKLVYTLNPQKTGRYNLYIAQSINPIEVHLAQVAYQLAPTQGPDTLVPNEGSTSRQYALEARYQDSVIIKQISLGPNQPLEIHKQRRLFANAIELVAGKTYEMALVYLGDPVAASAVAHGAIELVEEKDLGAMTRSSLWRFSKSYTDSSRPWVTHGGQVYVNMAKYAPDIVSWSQISTSQNRTGRVLDPYDIVIQRKDFADMLIRVNKHLMASGYRLMIYDGYRTNKATQALYDYTLTDFNKPKNQREYPELTKFKEISWYVVRPRTPMDRHGKGIAADVTLVDMETGEVVKMPTALNHIGAAAWLDEVLKKSSAYRVLLDAMKRESVRPYAREWYHFSYEATNEKKIAPPQDLLRQQFFAP